MTARQMKRAMARAETLSKDQAKADAQASEAKTDAASFEAALGSSIAVYANWEAFAALQPDGSGCRQRINVDQRQLQIFFDRVPVRRDPVEHLDPRGNRDQHCGEHKEHLTDQRHTDGKHVVSPHNKR